MKEYIDKDLAIQKLNLRHTMFKLTEDSDYKKGQLDARGEIDKIILDLPILDVAPVVHGRWLDTDTFDFHCVHIYQCSNCRKEVADDYIDNHKFCLHCGAKMDGGNKNGTV